MGVRLPGGHDYLLADPHVEADAIIVDVLQRLLRPPPGGAPASVLDLGAGIGQYGHALLSAEPSARWRGFDGAGNVEAATGGFVQFVDLTAPVSLPRADWVLSIEVGEHVPSQHEAMLIRNLHAHNTKGLILSWAGVAQGGNGHVNNHSQEYLIKLFEALGYDFDEGASKGIRAAAFFSWFRQTLFIFRRRQDGP